MSFEEHLRKNKERLDMKEVNPLIWDNVLLGVDTKAKGNSYSRYLLIGITALILLLLVGYIIQQNKKQASLLNETQQQLYAVRLTMNNLLNEQSSFSRIKAVNLTSEVDQYDPEIIRALFYTAQNDQSKNVRLAALNAIEKFSSFEEVKIALIETLKKSDKPFVQIKIINILSSIGEQRALPLLDEIIASAYAPSYVIEEASAAKTTITQIL